jgi:Flp pilus assembly protein TadD
MLRKERAMNRNTGLLALFAVSLAAGAWLFRSAPAPEIATEASCSNTGSCSAGVTPDPEPASPEDVAEPKAVPDSPLPPDSPRPPDSPPQAPRPASPSAPAVDREATGPAVDGKALRAEADRLLAEGRVMPGIEKLREATAADPTAKNHGDLGDLLGRLTAMDEALVHLRQAAELDPDNADRWIALANAYYRAVNPGEAWIAEKRAKEAEPGLVLGRDKSGRRVRQGDSEPRKP